MGLFELLGDMISYGPGIAVLDAELASEEKRATNDAIRIANSKPREESKDDDPYFQTEEYKKSINDTLNSIDSFCGFIRGMQLKPMTDDERKEAYKRMEAKVRRLHGGISPSTVKLPDMEGISPACRQLSEDLRECLEDFLEKQEDGEWELSGYTEIPEADADSYGSGEYDYPTKAKARLACREALRSVLKDARESYEAEKKAAMKEVGELLTDKEGELRSFAEEFKESFGDYVSLDMEEDGGVQEYLLQAAEEAFSGEELDKAFGALAISSRFERLMEELFKGEEEAFQEGRYSELCSFDEDDGTWCYELDDAVEELNSRMERLLEDACDGLGDKLQELYHSAASDLCRGLWKTAEEILQEQEGGGEDV